MRVTLVVVGLFVVLLTLAHYLQDPPEVRLRKEMDRQAARKAAAAEESRVANQTAVPVESQEVSKFQIWDAAKDYVRSKMKAPSQTDVRDWDIIYSKPPLYFVAVTVDAPNSFGVKLRESYTVLVRSGGGQATAFALQKGIMTTAAIERQIEKAAKSH